LPPSFCEDFTQSKDLIYKQWRIQPSCLGGGGGQGNVVTFLTSNWYKILQLPQTKSEDLFVGYLLIFLHFHHISLLHIFIPKFGHSFSLGWGICCQFYCNFTHFCAGIWGKKNPFGGHDPSSTLNPRLSVKHFKLKTYRIRCLLWWKWNEYVTTF